MGGRRSRTKGASFERWVANQLKPFFEAARRGIGQARSAGEVADVEGTPWWIEAKRHKKPSIPAAWRQASKATDGRPVVVISKADHEPALFTAEPELFFWLLLKQDKIDCSKARLINNTLVITAPFEDVCRILKK